MEVNSGPASARNAGLAVARKLGVQLVAFLDADCLPEVHLLAHPPTPKVKVMCQINCAVLVFAVAWCIPSMRLCVEGASGC